MKSKILISILFIFIWLVQVGGYLNNFNSSGNPLLLGSFRLCGMSLVMMIAPVIYKLFNKSTTNGNTFCAWNSVIVVTLWFVASIIIYGGIYDENFQILGENIIYGFAFYYINTRLFFPKNINMKFNYTKQMNNEICYCRKCGHKLIQDSIYCGKCGTKVEKLVDRKEV